MLGLNSGIGCYHSVGWFRVYLGLVQGLFREGYVGLVYGWFRVISGYLGLFMVI